MISHPPRTPTPNCRGDTILATFSEVAKARHLENSLLTISPTAIGRISPDFFLIAKSLPPQKKGAMKAGRLPAARRLVRQSKEVRLLSERLLGALRTATLR